jgi:3-oxoacyl-(acyl-carrier-protein) synthase
MIDCFNCHATSTPVGDAAEAQSIRNLLTYTLADRKEDFKHVTAEEIVEIASNLDIGDEKFKPVITAQKGHVGHLVTGAGAIETAFALLTLKTKQIPGIRNLISPLDPHLNFA